MSDMGDMGDMGRGDDLGDEVDDPIDAPGPSDVVDPTPAMGPVEDVDQDEVIGEIETGERLRDATKRAIEALVLVAEEPLASNLLGQLLEVSPVVVDRLCEELAAAYEHEGRGFQLVRVAGGWRYQSHPDQSAYVERFVLQGQTGKLSAAALETLAIVAYKQPISRAQVASIRGVSVDGVMRTLEQRGYIAEIGKDPGPGQAVLFGTTPSFLEKLGLDNIDELPPLGDFVPGADVVEQLERGLRPDRMPLRPEDAMMPGDIAPASVANGDGGFGDRADDVDGFDGDGMGFGDAAALAVELTGEVSFVGDRGVGGEAVPEGNGFHQAGLPDSLDLRQPRPAGGDDDRLDDLDDE